MTGRLLGLDLIALLLGLVLWVGAAVTIPRPPRRLGSGRHGSGLLRSGPLRSGPLRSGPLRSGPLRSGPLRSGPLGSGLLGAAVLVTACRVAVAVGLAGAGWAFVAEKVLTLPLAVLPGLAAAGWLWRGDRRIATAGAASAAGGTVSGLLATFVTGHQLTLGTIALLLVPPLAPLGWALARGRLRDGLVVAGSVLLLVMGVTAWSGSQVPGHHGGSQAGGTSVAELREPPAAPDRRFTLTARQADVRLPSGRAVAALTFDGQVPGPELAVTQGELVEVTLRNLDVPIGVTLHWHGYRVPAGDDGVAGVTQDAVPAGGEFTYRFRASEAGTFWYHSHQVAHEAVRKGLYGMFVVRPAAPQAGLDLAVPVHTLGGALLTGGVDGVDRRPAPPGTPVRLRIANTDSTPHVFTVRGTAFRVAAVDGRELADPAETMARLPLGAGGRYDVTFVMPSGPVLVGIDGRTDAGLVLGDGLPPPDPVMPPLLDVTQYPRPAPLPLRPPFDRERTMVLDQLLGFLDGVPAQTYTIDGAVWPDVAPIVVREGELLRLTVVNRSREPHPMHPHGHAVLVLSRNGIPASGPLWMDSFDVGPGEVWEVALRADNPGEWMNHCHNLDHAVAGMVLHLSYEGVTSPFTSGDATANHPE